MFKRSAADGPCSESRKNHNIAGAKSRTTICNPGTYNCSTSNPKLASKRSRLPGTLASTARTMSPTTAFGSSNVPKEPTRPQQSSNGPLHYPKCSLLAPTGAAVNILDSKAGGHISEGRGILYGDHLMVLLKPFKQRIHFIGDCKNY